MRVFAFGAGLAGRPPPLLPTKDCLWHGARPAVVGLKSKQFCTMESEAAFREVRRLVGELCKLEAPSKKTARSPYLSSLIRRVNQLTATCPLPSSPFKGIWRKGPCRKGMGRLASHLRREMRTFSKSKLRGLQVAVPAHDCRCSSKCQAWD